MGPPLHASLQAECVLLSHVGASPALPLLGVQAWVGVGSGILVKVIALIGLAVRVQLWEAGLVDRSRGPCQSKVPEGDPLMVLKPKPLPLMVCLVLRRLSFLVAAQAQEFLMPMQLSNVRGSHR